MKYLFTIPLLISLLFVSCSDKNDEPKSEQDKLIGYWAITHIKTIEHIGESHSTYDIDVPPHIIDSYVPVENFRWDILIFDEDFVTVRGDMPNHPREADYDMDTIDGQVEYLEALEQWYEDIGNNTDQLACPVGTYSIKGNNLIIGKHNMGVVSFVNDNEFTLDYKKQLNNTGDYKRFIYTYSRIYSLTL